MTSDLHYLCQDLVLAQGHYFLSVTEFKEISNFVFFALYVFNRDNTSHQKSYFFKLSCI